MASYVVLLTLTEEGRRNVTDLSGIDAAKQGVQAMGGQWKGWYMTMGQYDAVVIDAGNPATPGRGACPQQDQRGVSRPRGPRCDIGAVER